MKKLSAALLLLATTAYAQAYDNSLTEDAIKKRLAPIGSVYLEGDKAAAAAEPTGPRSGEQVYQAACFACHGTGALGAPKSADDWAPRIAKGKDTLLDHALNGFNAMPPKGTCMDCSEDEISAAIDFMTSK
ncbi:cytochrome c5 family protein [Pseudoalteromonas shioyasakiensis]|uniref:Cytochrome c n=1 Tax=Pseudoalteromonas gelatinilytica TaxID=1703256 RepID=A0ABQ1U826_9GAMM|nr:MULTISPECIES: cytochrome c5 family protein [Pseudoalteromonas]MAD05338.1 cytochrome c5 family protein [Pseudoalteromonas sp.]MCG9708769.1 cytochrome c5 family protein [Pseudoalteromonas sp. Isolate3]MCP4585522.1 cytochrome c5 family protein [Pseudoalteromonas sp.]MCQ8883093.1 cytochrome c5 family protein [Pseudoalteromonas shioyasakiensis]NIZ07244.1 cytochrome c5 family protein [Pseudoalteromonas sp. HF66]|tara:strand:+ start:7606 stop:7998 length:393 start_codon:yes stop_codon:yes gene_type:complete